MGPAMLVSRIPALRFGPPVTRRGSKLCVGAEAAVVMIGEGRLPTPFRTGKQICVGLWLQRSLRELRLEGLQSGEGL